MKKKRTHDWLVRAYNKKDKIIDAVIIEDRTEHEAEKEATPTVANSADWTMVKMKDELKRFSKEWGQDDEELACNLGLDAEDDGFSEMALNHDYIWLAPHGVWVPENNRFYDKSDDIVIQYIKEKNSKGW